MAPIETSNILTEEKQTTNKTSQFGSLSLY
jgi:hypothetical protein